MNCICCWHLPIQQANQIFLCVLWKLERTIRCAEKSEIKLTKSKYFLLLETRCRWNMLTKKKEKQNKPTRKKERRKKKNEEETHQNL